MESLKEQARKAANKLVVHSNKSMDDHDTALRNAIRILREFGNQPTTTPTEALRKAVEMLIKEEESESL